MFQMKTFNRTKHILFALGICICLNYGCINGNDTTVNDDQAITESDDLCLAVIPRTINLVRINKNKFPRNELRYELKNGSDSIVRINKIDVSCGCVTIVSFNYSIIPNHTETITAEIDLSNQSEHLRKIIFVNYNDGQVKRAKVIADIED